MRNGCSRTAWERSSSPASPNSLYRLRILYPVFSLIPNSEQISVIVLLRSRQAWIKSLLSDTGELSLHGTGTSQIVPECDAATSRLTYQPVSSSPINRSVPPHLPPGHLDSSRLGPAPLSLDPTLTALDGRSANTQTCPVEIEKSPGWLKKKCPLSVGFNRGLQSGCYHVSRDGLLMAGARVF